MIDMGFYYIYQNNIEMKLPKNKQSSGKQNSAPNRLLSTWQISLYLRTFYIKNVSILPFPPVRRNMYLIIQKARLVIKAKLSVRLFKRLLISWSTNGKKILVADTYFAISYVRYINKAASKFSQEK